jgi:hypothetical protein
MDSLTHNVRPRRGGTRLYCPLVSIIGDDIHDPLCHYPSRADTARGAAAIRRHFRVHVEQFKAAKSAKMIYAFNAPKGAPCPGARLEYTISKGRFAREERED